MRLGDNMSKSVKISKDDIVKAAYEIAKARGIDAATATAIAQRLKCSVQPIYYVFENMDNLRNAVLEKAMEKYTESLLEDIPGMLKTKAIGLNYIYFAKKYPHLFRLIFFSNRQKNVNILKSSCDKNKPYILELIKKEFNIDDNRVEDIYIKSGIFCNGIASMIRAKTADFTNEDIDRLITEMFYSLIA
jgi:AcrR family transcriptional regulator